VRESELANITVLDRFVPENFLQEEIPGGVTGQVRERGKLNKVPSDVNSR